MPEAIGKLACGQCGKNYVWKPEFAGKTLKCKCGASIKAPAAPVGAKAAPAARPAPAAVAAGPAHLDDIEKMLSQAAEYDVKEEPAPPPRSPVRITAAPGAVMSGAASGAAVASPASPLLAYARTIRKPIDEGSQGAAITDIYVPLALIAVGLLTYYLDSRLYGIRSIPVAGIFIVFKTVINLALVFTALIIGVQLIDLGLGPIGPALLKIAAVALLPAALGDIIGYYTMGLVPWIFSALMYGILLYVMFDMEYSEIAISTAIIWFVQTWVGMLLIGVLLAMVGAGHPAVATGSSFAGPPVRGAGGSASGTGLFSPDTGTESDEPRFEPTVEGQDKRAEYLIKKGDAAEAREWLKPEHTDHAGVKYTIGTMREWTDKLYTAGAKKVWVADFYDLGKQKAAHRMLIEMPADKTARTAVLRVMADVEKHPDDPDPDSGARYLHISVAKDLEL